LTDSTLNVKHTERTATACKKKATYRRTIEIRRDEIKLHKLTALESE